MCRNEKSIEAMAEKIRGGDYNDFGKLLHLCAYVPKETFAAAEKLGYEKVGERKKSYTDPQEDAVIMTLKECDTE